MKNNEKIEIIIEKLKKAEGITIDDLITILKSNLFSSQKSFKKNEDIFKLIIFYFKKYDTFFSTNRNDVNYVANILLSIISKKSNPLLSNAISHDLLFSIGLYFDEDLLIKWSKLDPYGDSVGYLIMKRNTLKNSSLKEAINSVINNPKFSIKKFIDTLLDYSSSEEELINIFTNIEHNDQYSDIINELYKRLEELENDSKGFLIDEIDEMSDEELLLYHPLVLGALQIKTPQDSKDANSVKDNLKEIINNELTIEEINILENLRSSLLDNLHNYQETN